MKLTLFAKFILFIILSFSLLAYLINLNNKSDNITKVNNKSGNITKVNNKSGNITKVNNKSDNIKKVNNKSGNIKKVNSKSNNIKKVNNKSGNIKRVNIECFNKIIKSKKSKVCKINNISSYRNIYVNVKWINQKNHMLEREVTKKINKYTNSFFDYRYIDGRKGNNYKVIFIINGDTYFKTTEFK